MKKTEAPTKMSQAQADALYRAFSEIDKAQQRIQELVKKRDGILAELQISPDQLGRTVGLNLDTLEIHRAAPLAEVKDGK